MAFSTENRDVHLVGPGVDIAGRKNVVTGGTFAAGGSIGSTSFQGSSMSSFKKFFVRFVVANSAIDFLQSFRMREILHVRILMAINAFSITVHRSSIPFEIHIEGDRPTTAFGGQFRV
jgi:hypothetical protein